MLHQPSKNEICNVMNGFGNSVDQFQTYPFQYLVTIENVKWLNQTTDKLTKTLFAGLSVSASHGRQVEYCLALAAF